MLPIWIYLENLASQRILNVKDLEFKISPPKNVKSKVKDAFFLQIDG